MSPVELPAGENASLVLMSESRINMAYLEGVIGATKDVVLGGLAGASLLKHEETAVTENRPQSPFPLFAPVYFPFFRVPVRWSESPPAVPACLQDRRLEHSAMLLFREKVPATWLPKILSNLPAVLVDHAHLERKAATTALNLEKYRDLFPRVAELNAIAIEELQHFQLVLDLLKRRGIPFGQPYPSAWISGPTASARQRSGTYTASRPSA